TFHRPTVKNRKKKTQELLMLALAILDVIASIFLIKLVASFFIAKLVQKSCSRNFLRETLANDTTCYTSTQNQRKYIFNKSSTIKPQPLQNFNNATPGVSIEFEIPSLFLHEILLSPTEPVNPRPPQTATIPSNPVSSVAPHELIETAANYNLSIDVPGFARGDLSIIVVDDLRQLKIVGKNSTRKPIDMVVIIPRLANMEKIEASVADGVLNVVIPKRDRDGRVVDILSGHQEQARANSFSRSVPENNSANDGFQFIV
ncbi:hypothetical protein HK100_002268, partial [Physocladia obscura]